MDGVAKGFLLGVEEAHRPHKLWHLEIDPKFVGCNWKGCTSAPMIICDRDYRIFQRVSIEI